MIVAASANGSAALATASSCAIENMLHSRSYPSSADIIHRISKEYREVYTVASCAADTISGTRDQLLLRFTRISETDNERK